MDIMSSPSYLPSPWYSVKDDITAITDQQLQSAKDRAASVDRLIKLYGEVTITIVAIIIVTMILLQLVETSFTA